MNQADRDLLIRVDENLKDVKNDLRGVSDALREMKAVLDATREQTRDHDTRITSLTATVTGLKLDRDADRKDLNETRADIARWKLYGKIAMVLLSPLYVMLLYAAEQLLRQWLFP